MPQKISLPLSPRYSPSPSPHSSHTPYLLINHLFISFFLSFFFFSLFQMHIPALEEVIDSFKKQTATTKKEFGLLFFFFFFSLLFSPPPPSDSREEKVNRAFKALKTHHTNLNKVLTDLESKTGSDGEFLPSSLPGFSFLLDLLSFFALSTSSFPNLLSFPLSFFFLESAPLCCKLATTKPRPF